MIAVLLAIVSFGSTLLGGIIALKRSDRIHIFMGLGAGMLVGAALFDLMPEGIELASRLRLAPVAVTGTTALGFVAVYFLEKYLAYHSHPEPAYGEANHVHIGDIGALSMTLHSFLDGTAIGVGFHVSLSVGFLIAAAVIAHDFSDGLATSMLLFQNRASKTRTYLWLIADASAPAAGALLTQLLTIPPTILCRLLALFAGLFLYLGASHLLPEAHRTRPTASVMVATVGGFAFLYVVTLMVRS